MLCLRPRLRLSRGLLQCLVVVAVTAVGVCVFGFALGQLHLHHGSGPELAPAPAAVQSGTSTRCRSVQHQHHGDAGAQPGTVHRVVRDGRRYTWLSVKHARPVGCTPRTAHRLLLKQVEREWRREAKNGSEAARDKEA